MLGEDGIEPLQNCSGGNGFEGLGFGPSGVVVCENNNVLTSREWSTDIDC
jgi:hypothetical protein